MSNPIRIFFHQSVFADDARTDVDLEASASAVAIPQKDDGVACGRIFGTVDSTFWTLKPYGGVEKVDVFLHPRPWAARLDDAGDPLDYTPDAEAQAEREAQRATHMETRP